MKNPRLFTLPDRDLDAAGAALEKKLEATASAITPEELPAVLDNLMRRCIDAAFNHAGAHEGTLWLIQPETDTLVAAYNNRDPEFIGFVQPLGSGLVSMVVATEQPICENEVYRNREHSGEADSRVGKITWAMIAVPLYYGGALRGVVSCVQHKDDASGEDPPGFGSEDLENIEMLAELIGRLVDQRLSRRILGIEE